MSQEKQGIKYKTLEEIELIRLSGDLLGRTQGLVSKTIKSGITTKSLDKLAYEYISDNGAHPSFKGYNGFPYSLCISVNDVVVHGMPSDYEIKDGDIVSVDCGVLLNGFHADSAYTYPVGNVKKETMQLLIDTKASLFLGIEAAQAGNRTGDIGSAVQQFVEAKGYSVVRELVGHGLGRSLHESPEVPNYGKKGKGTMLSEGLVIAIEPMVNLGKKQIFQDRDGWTIRTADRKPSAHFEHTIAIVEGKPQILTTFQYIDEVFQF
ncbi:methionyl aminopeptidase [Flexibacter flexilis DSM 6793]|uniref:Methionine aminopeptidase n=1 Tax=Flexibacter flexilis DSM 6793 TaxID=927664 RepID=A0A1I1K0Z4_9BACT|nr:type I methionyl aminopeptidase [Flexibacter flexilis]SFC54504.1 methionyl aminopeptidase [Flexibacter flexilis DSM 6793]